MEILKVKRKSLRTAFTKFCNVIDEAIKQNISISEDTNCLATFELLRDKNDQLMSLNNEILNLLLASENIEEDIIEKEVSSADEYSLKFKKISLLFNQKSRSNVDIDTQSVTSENMKRKFKLPRLELKKFGGEIKDWLPFWGQFRKIDEDSEIDEADKLQYLIQATIPNSRAREIVESFPPSSGNYAKAIDCLKSRFAKDDLLVEYYVRELLKLTLTFNAKDKQIKLSTMYDRIETQLRSLETLGVTSAKYAAMLFPLVESCLSEDILRAWQRNDNGLMKPSKEESRLDNLMRFLKNEVENEGRIELAMQGFSLKENVKNVKPKRDLPTAAGLFVGNRTGILHVKCAFCDKDNHESKDCRFARNLDFNERMARLKKCGCCYRCLKTGHMSKRCKVRVSCEVCDRRHHVIMCPEGQNNLSSPDSKETSVERKDEHLSSLANPTCTANVFLQTLVVLLRGENEDFAVRALIDSGSQKSYITKEAAEKMKYPAIKETTLKHVLFGGIESQQKHFEYKIFVSDFHKKYYCTFDVLDQVKICSEIPQAKTPFCSKELKDLGILLADQEYFSHCSSSTIHLLIGADVAGKLMTGKIVNLSCGLTAIETSLGWTIMGKSPVNEQTVAKADCMVVTNLLIKEFAISDLWKLETLGINDPCEAKKKEEIHEDTLKYFQSTVSRDEENRYEVALPWVLEPSRLPNHKEMAEKRLASTYKKLIEMKKVEAYQEVFDQWVSEKIIEEVKTQNEESAHVHYLPHRPVIKESSSTTKIRPVFDASAHLKGMPSLNACLETGPNLIELVPSVLNRFRKFEVGITSDIEKAFLQIGIQESDRDYLRFLWKTEDDKVKIYRHRRVVFGINCSPFLLAATLNYHLENAPDNLSKTAQTLKSSFYVDNCVCSLKNKDEANKFVIESRVLMSAGKFNLRDWRSNAPLEAIEQPDDYVVPLLGLNWNLKEDTLSCNISSINEEQKVLTKRGLLSLAQSIFDPLGIYSPVTITPKFILQETWSRGLKWEDDLPEDLAKRFSKWLQKIQLLSNVKIPRWMKIGQDDEENISLHVFCDASNKAYATVIFLRVEVNQKVSIQFVQSRARVAPLKNLTIPRLELLSCCIGSRLSKNVIQDLQLPNIKVFYWSDSLTAVCWIKRDVQWGTFVWNRVKEIRALTQVEQWRHVPGKLNPADLPTRGCSPEQFVQMKWWEGPEWLYGVEESWPQSMEVADEEIVNSEKRKTVISAHNNIEETQDWYYRPFSSYLRNIRMLAWIQRFCKNARKIETSNSKALSLEEIKNAEKRFMILIQKEAFEGPSDPRLRSLDVVEDEDGLLRVKTRIIYRQDSDNFRYPVILPGDHPAVKNLIMHKHKTLMHCGIQILMAIIREHYWILSSRKSIRKVLNSCVRCKRFTSKPLKLNLPSLPEDRVKDAAIFEVTGIDLAGPLYLKDGTKTWIALFTCAVYRAIHLELLSSLSTEEFLLALRRFIARRGRPSVIYSDNGTNLKGANRLLRSIDWERVEEEGTKREIIWKFIPPSAPWWGGWWERLVKMVKDLLRRVLGNASLRYEELNTLLCDCEEIVNSRPITYISENDDLVPLTPSMFLRESREEGSVLNLDHLKMSSADHRRRYLYKKKLHDDLKSRFRLEYLGHLRQETKSIRRKHEVQVGEVVLVEVPNQKRLNWPMGKIVEIFPGKDGFVRLVKVKTKNGEFLRPVQRLYFLEVHSATEGSIQKEMSSRVKNSKNVTRKLHGAEHVEELPETELDHQLKPEIKKTRLGREVRVPKRLNL